MCVWFDSSFVLGVLLLDICLKERQRAALSGSLPRCLWWPGLGRGQPKLKPGPLCEWEELYGAVTAASQGLR